MKLNKQLLLSVGAITGMCCAVGTAVYATPKAKELADKYKDDKVEAAKRVAPLYIPTFLSFIAATGCIFAKDYISKKDLLALTASTTAATSYLAANRDKLKKQILENPRVKNLKNALIPTKEEFKHQTIEETGHGDLLVIEGYSGRIFRSSAEAVEDAEKRLSEKFMEEKYACLNDFYTELGIELTHFGHQWGWVNDPDWYDNQPIDFENTFVPADGPGNEWGEDMIVIDLYTYPMECWQEI